MGANRGSSSLQHHRGNAGVATVEFALVAPLLVFILLTITEFGLVSKNALVLTQAAREGARAASLGNPVATVCQRATSAAPTVKAASLTVTCYYRTETNGVWSDWCPLTDDGVQNSAPSGSQVKVAVQYDHCLVTGALTGRLPNSANGRVTLAQSAVAQRE